MQSQEGSSIERMEKDGNSSSEGSPRATQPKGIISYANAEQELKDAAEKAKQRAAEKELKKKVEVKKNTLADILRLKAEIEEVSTTLRVS